MIVLDTNVVSELLRPRPNPAIVAWVDRLAHPVVASPLVFELMHGAMRLPMGSRRLALLTEIDAMLAEDLDDRVLPLDHAAAIACAAITVHRAALGRPISPADAQIAAICATNDAALATRNGRDFEHTGIEILDPWDQPVE